jgi:hypothetical protein
VQPDAGRVLKCYGLLFQGVCFEEIAACVGFPSGRGVAYILRNPCWKAVRRFEPNTLRPVPLEISMGIEPLISPERWSAAQVILDQKRTAARARRRQVRTPALGLGLLRCGCGRFHYLRRDYRTGQHDLFYCGSGYKGESCGAPSIRRELADAAIQTSVAALTNAKTLRAILEKVTRKPAAKPQATAKTERELARCGADRERLVDMRMKDKITEREFDARAARLAAEVRDLEAALPKPEPELDPRALAAAVASLLAEFRFLPAAEQCTLARRLFVAFDVVPGGDAIGAAVMRGAVVAQEYANNIRRSILQCSRRSPAPASARRPP